MWLDVTCGVIGGGDRKRQITRVKRDGLVETAAINAAQYVSVCPHLAVYTFFTTLCLRRV